MQMSEEATHEGDQKYLSEFQDTLHAELRVLIDAAFSMANASENALHLGNPKLLAERMVSSIPRTSATNLECGPFYTTQSLTRWLGVTRQYVHELVRQRRIIGVYTADHHKMYPAFQFGKRGATLPGLSEILHVLDDVLEPRAITMWFVTPQPELKNTSPAEWLRSGHDVAPVLESADMYAHITLGAPKVVKS